MKFVNLTPHQISYSTPEGLRISYPPSGVVCRLSASSTLVKSHIPGIIAIKRHYGFLADFPNEPDTVYIVPLHCLEFAPPDARVISPAENPEDDCVEYSEGDAITRWVVPNREDNDVRKEILIEAANMVDEIAEQLEFDNCNSFPPGGSFRGPQTKLGWVKKIARELKAWAGVPQDGVGYLQKHLKKDKKNVTDRQPGSKHSPPGF